MSEVKITPLARRLAEENGIDWRQIKGTGPDGTVVERDILAFLARVMAGEVNLPPAPEEMAPPPGAIPDMAQAQAALQKEGVQLGDLVPPPPATTPPASSPPPPTSPLSGAPTMDDIEFDLDLDLDTPPPPVPPAAEAFEEAPTLAPEPSLVPDFDEPEPLVATEPLPTLQWEEPEPLPTVAPVPEVNPELAGLPPLPTETELEPPSTAPKLIWETQEVVTTPEVPTPPPSPLQAGMSFSNTPEPVVPPAPAYQPPVEAPPAAPTEQVAPPAAQEMPQMPLEQEPAPPPSAGPLTPPAPEPAVPPAPTPTTTSAAVAPAEATPGPKMLRVQAWQRLVEIGPAQNAAQTLSEAWRMEVGLYPLLYRAVDKALADTQTPLRPTKGSLEGDELKSLRVAPSQSLRGALDSLRMASDPAEGLVVLSLVDSAFDQVIFPGTAALTLGRASGGHALLSLSGPMDADHAGKLLERVAYYLERPILLA
ncbi:E3 binding domain-containing protein [Meiothermus sp. CFH 77666]|uniref:E3 binding domain-containing protein n=1 Tax=Meiothermus sp. CFH 77666 TaxID=2817942 RepID=UPI001AA02E35|nr:E3 binding domain-containing protein [Meiothermus sp. CFH 77666]MBO1437023.1 E3 binding domain-containing protein [Meiothermus sp. CFH 77666]